MADLSPNLSMYGNIATPNALQGAGQAVGVAQGVQNLQRSQLELQILQMDNMRQRLGALAAKGQALTGADVRKEASDLVSLGQLTPKQAAITLQNLSDKDPMTFVQGHLVNTIQGMEKLYSIYGVPGTLHMGGETYGTQQGVLPGTPGYGLHLQPTAGPAGALGPQGGVAQTLGPAEKVAPIQEVNPLTGTTVRRSLGEIYDERAAPRGEAPVLALPPGTPEAMQEAGKNFAQDISAYNNRADILNPLEKAVPILQKLGDTGTGPGAEQYALLKKFLVTSGVAKALPDDPSAGFDEAKKYLAQYANDMSSGDRGTDLRLLRNIEGSPNTTMSNAAAESLALQGLALQRLRIAKAAAFAKTGLPENQYNKWGGAWIGQQDPTAFIIDMMKPEARKKYKEHLQGLGADSMEVQRFMRSHKDALDTQLVRPR